MIDWTKPIETMDGRPARVLCMDFLCADHNPVVVAIRWHEDRNQEYIQRMTPEGWFWPHRETDLIRNKQPAPT